MPGWPPPEYRITVDFDAPRGFVYRWCTDYRPGDDRRAGERYDRRIVRRSAREVVFEDLWWEKDGWRWRRYRVTLDPPDHWIADSRANYRDALIDYRLHERPGGGTRLELRMRRRPVPDHPAQPARRPFEADLRRMWKHFRTALERDYARRRRSTRARSR